MEVDSLAPGVGFVEALEESVGACDVLIAVIGRHWLSALDEEGRRRLDKPGDFVRIEIATALKRGIRVIPVLVDGAMMPQPNELPHNLKSLTRRNALNVSHDRFRAHTERLIGAMERVLEGARVEQQRKREGQERVSATFLNGRLIQGVGGARGFYAQTLPRPRPDRSRRSGPNP